MKDSFSLIIDKYRHEQKKQSAILRYIVKK